MNRRQILIAGDLIKKSLLIEKLMYSYTYLVQDKDTEGNPLVKEINEITKEQAPLSIQELKDVAVETCNAVSKEAGKLSAFTQDGNYKTFIDESLPVYNGSRVNINNICTVKASRVVSDKISVETVVDKTELAALTYVFEFETAYNELYTVCCHDSESIAHKTIRCVNIMNDFLDVAAIELRAGNTDTALKRLAQIVEYSNIYSNIKQLDDLSIFDVALNDLDNDVSEILGAKNMAVPAIESAKNIVDLIAVADNINHAVQPLVMVRRQ